MAPDLLAELRDIHQPPDPAWWPPAPGWWLLGITAALALVVLAMALRRREQRVRPRRRALALARQLAAGAGPDGPDESLRQLSLLLRRAALQAFPRDEVAGLAGHRWLEFLDRTGGTDQFTAGPGRSLASAPYEARGSGDIDALVALSESWIRRNL